MARLLETDSLSNQNITTALEIGSYTAAATRLVFVRVLADQLAGNGDYTFYATLQVGGAGSAYRLIPITTANAASGLTAAGAVTIGIPVDNGDILKVYLLGLAGDTTTPDTRVDFYENDYLKPTTADRTLDVTTTGEAGIDWANVGGPTTTVNLSGTTVKTVTDPVAKSPATLAAGDVSGNLPADVKAYTVQPTVSGATLAASQHVIVDSGTVTTLTNAPSDSAGVTTLLTRLSAARAGYLDYLAGWTTTIFAQIAGIIDTLLGTNHGSGAWGASGAGLHSNTITVNDQSGNPVDGATVDISTDTARSNVIKSGTTNSLGQITFYFDAAGTYYAWTEYSTTYTTVTVT